MMKLLRKLLKYATQSSQPELITGGVYAAKDRHGMYRIYKIIAADERIVAVRIYRNAFKELPENIDLKILSIALSPGEDPEKMFRPESEMKLDVGCTPIDRSGFLSSGARLLAKIEVTEEEIGSYRQMIESQQG